MAGVRLYLDYLAPSAPNFLSADAPNIMRNVAVVVALSL